MSKLYLEFSWREQGPISCGPITVSLSRPLFRIISPIKYNPKRAKIAEKGIGRLFASFVWRDK